MTAALGSLSRGGYRQLGAALRVFLLLTLLLGVIWPLAATGVAQVVARPMANGSLLERDGAVVGSSLIGQNFQGDQWFQPRPSALDYSGESSGGANLSPVGQPQLALVHERADALRRANPDAPADIPSDALTTSGSGLDPDISPAYAEWQVSRVATARGISRDDVRRLVADHTTGRTLGFLGQPRVNVLQLNLALDAAAPAGG